MAKLVVKAQYLELPAGTDRSAQVKGVTLTIDAPEVDTTNMASGGWFEALGGIFKGTLAVEWVKDADLSGLDAAMFAALGATQTFLIRQTSAALGADNPKYTGSVLVTQWSPIQGSLGAAFGGSTSWTTTGTVSRAIA